MSSRRVSFQLLVTFSQLVIPSCYRVNSLGNLYYKGPGYYDWESKMAASKTFEEFFIGAIWHSYRNCRYFKKCASLFEVISNWKGGDFAIILQAVVEDRPFIFLKICCSCTLINNGLWEGDFWPSLKKARWERDSYLICKQFAVSSEDLASA